MTNGASYFPLPPPMPVPVTPDVETWRAMSLAEREAFIISVNEALSDPVITMSEGRPHKKAKSKAQRLRKLILTILASRNVNCSPSKTEADVFGKNG